MSKYKKVFKIKQKKLKVHREDTKDLSKKFWRLESSSIGANLEKYERLCFGIKNKFECLYISIGQCFLFKNTLKLFKIL